MTGRGGPLPLAWRPVEGPRGRAEPFGVFVAADPDALLEGTDEAAFRASDERMPYFGTLWPAGESLAAFVLGRDDLAGRRVLDLGCGTGAAGLAAARAGARVTFLDWEPRALDLVAASARRLGVVPEALRAEDWRGLEAGRSFDLVLGADLLYEARNLAPVLAALAASLASGGEAWLADPGRPHAAGLETAAALAGVVVAGREPLPPRPHGVAVVRVVLRRPGSRG